MTDEPIRVDPFLQPHSDSPSDRERRYAAIQPLCDRCWFRDNPEKLPIRKTFAGFSLDRCSGCGRSTEMSGIYVRVDLNSCPYPSILENGERERF